MRAKKSVSMKALVVLLAVVLLIGCVAGGTLAWLITKSNDVTNTFVAGDIGKLTLTESTGATYMIIPGKDIAKDPVVTFSGNNVPAYLFIVVDAPEWTRTNRTYSINSDETEGENDNGMSWTVADGWTLVDDTTNVYYRTVAADTDLNNVSESEKYSIIYGNEIVVSEGITMASIGDYVNTLTFTSYAIQKDGFATVAAAWAEAKK